jgi:very-short-patch-repair endonuclease
MAEERIAALAAGQHGVVTHSQLEAAGISRSAIGRRVASGRLRSLHRGVYSVAPFHSDRAPEMAAVFAGGSSAVLSHTSAIGLWGLLRIDPPCPVHVTVPGGGRARRPGITFHRTASLDEDERADVDGISATTPARTIVDSAGLLGHRELELALATAEREGLIQAAELAALPARYAGRPGMSMLRALLREGAEPHFTRSEAERRCIDLVRAAGLPRPHANVTVGAYELDLFWPEENVAIEIDGYRHHSSRVRFEGDRRKDNWLRARGIEVIRLTWRQITRERIATAVLVGQALTRAQSWVERQRAQRQRGAVGEPRQRDGGEG